MKTLHVGGTRFFNQFSNLETAVERAGDDDTIELHKDIHDVAVYVNKEITIIGNDHCITPKAGKAALDCASSVVLKDIRFECPPRTNAVIIRNGGELSGIKTKIIGPARALYPTVVQRGGSLAVKDSEIMQMETYRAHGTNLQTFTCVNDSKLLDYYGGSVYLNNGDRTLSKFRGLTMMFGSDITCALLDGDCKLSNTILRNFNKVVGKLKLESCTLAAAKSTFTPRQDEPADSPLRDVRSDVIPYALHIAGARVESLGHTSVTDCKCFGFYMTSGSMDIKYVRSDNSRTRHLIKDGAITFKNVVDNGFYEINTGHCTVIQSRINTSLRTKSAMDELDSMIGLHSVKRQLHTIMNTIRVNKANPEKDFGFSHHMVFAGDPGTGKTTVAKLAARALYEIGAIPENKYMEIPASQMVKGYVGQTGAHVEKVMEKALGGVLFIDEAYELMVKDGQNTFNNDALGVMLRYMEDHRSELVVIVAGYAKEMREFLASNVGLARRFQWVDFEDYSPEELSDILLTMSDTCKESYVMDEPKSVFVHCFRKLTDFYLSHPDKKGRITNGGNGGLARNLFQQVIFARNNRVAGSRRPNMKITLDDIYAGFYEEIQKAKNILA